MLEGMACAEGMVGRKRMMMAGDPLKLSDSYNRDAIPVGGAAGETLCFGLEQGMRRTDQHGGVESSTMTELFLPACSNYYSSEKSCSTDKCAEAGSQRQSFSDRYSVAEFSFTELCSEKGCESLLLAGGETSKISNSDAGSTSAGGLEASYNRREKELVTINTVNCANKMKPNSRNCNASPSTPSFLSYHRRRNSRVAQMRKFAKFPKHFAAFCLLFCLYYDCIPGTLSARFPTTSESLSSNVDGPEQQQPQPVLGDNLLHHSSKHCNHHYPKPHEVSKKTCLSVGVFISQELSSVKMLVGFTKLWRDEKSFLIQYYFVMHSIKVTVQLA